MVEWVHKPVTLSLIIIKYYILNAIAEIILFREGHDGQQSGSIYRTQEHCIVLGHCNGDNVTRQ